jgi:hypothetical protein
MPKKKKERPEVPYTYRVRASETALQRAGGWENVLKGSFYFSLPAKDDMPSRAALEAGDADDEKCFTARERPLVMIPYRDHDGQVIVLWAGIEEDWVKYLQPGVLPLVDCLGNYIDEAS